MTMLTIRRSSRGGWSHELRVPLSTLKKTALETLRFSKRWDATGNSVTIQWQFKFKKVREITDSNVTGTAPNRVSGPCELYLGTSYNYLTSRLHTCMYVHYDGWICVGILPVTIVLILVSFKWAESVAFTVWWYILGCWRYPSSISLKHYTTVGEVSLLNRHIPTAVYNSFNLKVVQGARKITRSLWHCGIRRECRYFYIQRYIRGSDLRLSYRIWNIESRVATPMLELRCKTFPGASVVHISSPLGRTSRWLVYLAHAWISYLGCSQTVLALTYIGRNWVSLFSFHNMRLVTISRGVRLNCLKPRALNGSSRRYLTMLSPPKFENEKMVSNIKVRNWTLTNSKSAQLRQRLSRKSWVDQDDQETQGTISFHNSHHY